MPYAITIRPNITDQRVLFVIPDAVVSEELAAVRIAQQYTVDNRSAEHFTPGCFATIEVHEFEGTETPVEFDEFDVHGTYGVSNSFGYEVELSRDYSRARTRCYFDAVPSVSIWHDITEVENEDYDPSDEYSEAFVSVIDPEGMNVPLNMVMRA